MSQVRKMIDQSERKRGFAEPRFTGNQDPAIAKQDRRCMQILRLGQLSLSRQRNHKTRAPDLARLAAGDVLGSQRAALSFDDLPADRQSEA